MKQKMMTISLVLTICVFGFAQMDSEKKYPVPNDEGKVSLEKTEFEIFKKDIDYLLRRKRPLVKLSFTDGKEIDEESFYNIKGILDTHWKSAITFYYNDVIEKTSNAITSNEWENELLKRQELLETYTFNAPNGKRNFSHNEVFEILSSLNKSASEIVETAKGINGEYQEIKIKSKPFASARDCGRGSGATRILITFDKSGKITNAEIKEMSGCDSFDKSALKSAEKIKFKPAQVGNEPVTVKRTIVYNFRIG